MQEGYIVNMQCALSRHFKTGFWKWGTLAFRPPVLSQRTSVRWPSALLPKGDPWRHKPCCAVLMSQIAKSLLIDWTGEAARRALGRIALICNKAAPIIRLSHGTAGSPPPCNSGANATGKCLETEYSAVADGTGS
jgi:hypothetical protein